MPSYYIMILDEIMEKWLGIGFDNRELHNDISAPYRMLAVLLNDPWNDNCTFDSSKNSFGYERHFIVDIEKPEIRRKLDILNGPYSTTMIKMLELEWVPNEDSTRNSNGIESSCGTLV